MLADGSVFWGHGIGATGRAIGELCFNTAMTGYQEIVTDPSYAGQIITFTFPHIGNTGANGEDIEAQTPAARGIVIRDAITDPSSFRASGHFDGWLRANNLVGITGIDTRRLTRLVRSRGFQTAGIDHGAIDCPGLAGELAAWPGLEGMDLAREVTCRQTYTWTEGTWSLQCGHAAGPSPRRHVVAVDYGVKRNILRHLVSLGCRVTVVPATSGIADIMRHRPDGIFLSNGPGDPAATGTWAVPVIRDLLETGKPVFGICLGHQLAGAGAGRADTEDGERPPRGQPPRQEPGNRRGGDHLPEPRICRRPRQSSRECRDHPRVTLRRHSGRLQDQGEARLFCPVPSRGESRTTGQPLQGLENFRSFIKAMESHASAH